MTCARRVWLVACALAASALLSAPGSAAPLVDTEKASDVYSVDAATLDATARLDGAGTKKFFESLALAPGQAPPGIVVTYPTFARDGDRVRSGIDFDDRTQILLHTQVTYDVNKRVTLVGNFANIVNRCFGGSKIAYDVHRSEAYVDWTFRSKLDCPDFANWQAQDGAAFSRSLGAAPWQALTPRTDFFVPPYGQVGQPILIYGDFRGNFGVTPSLPQVTFQGTPCPFLAGTPYANIVVSPARTGTGTIVIDTGTTKIERPFANVDVTLKGNTNLLKGQSSVIQGRVTGLPAPRGSMRLRMQNLSTGVVSMAGGDDQEIAIPPSESDTFTFTRTVTAIQKGNFSLLATLEIPKPN